MNSDFMTEHEDQETNPIEIEIDAAKIFQEILEAVNKDPETKRLAEEYQRLYGTLTSDDLKMQFTI